MSKFQCSGCSTESFRGESCEECEKKYCLRKCVVSRELYTVQYAVDRNRDVEVVRLCHACFDSGDPTGASRAWVLTDDFRAYRQRVQRAVRSVATLQF
jgi:methionyl-tRNA synthetase